MCVITHTHIEEEEWVLKRGGEEHAPPNSLFGGEKNNEEEEDDGVVVDDDDDDDDATPTHHGKEGVKGGGDGGGVRAGAARGGKRATLARFTTMTSTTTTTTTTTTTRSLLPWYSEPVEVAHFSKTKSEETFFDARNLKRARGPRMPFDLNEGFANFRDRNRLNPASGAADAAVRKPGKKRESERAARRGRALVARQRDETFVRAVGKSRRISIRVRISEKKGGGRGGRRRDEFGRQPFSRR